MTTLEAPTTLAISDAAAATGLSVHTLRYYERAGLMLDPVDRASSSHRRYTDRDVQWVTLLRRLRQTGMPIRTIRAYADLVRLGEGNEHARLALLEAHRERVLEQLRQTQENLQAIDAKVALYQAKIALD